MKILSLIISSIWNAVTFMDKEQRALVAHVLQVSNACPDQFTPDHVQHLRDWHSFSLDIHFYPTKRVVKLGEVQYRLNRRAAAILNKNFYQLHLMQHHHKVGKKISEIDAGNTQLPTHKHSVNLAEWVGRNVFARMEDRDIIGGDVQFDESHQTYRVGIHRGFSGSGKYLGERTALKDITHISDKIPESSPHEASSWEFEYTGDGMTQMAVQKPTQPIPEIKPIGGLGKPSWKKYEGAKKTAPEPIDLAKYVGKNCYVEMSNGDKGNCYVNYLQTEDAVLLLDSELLFNRYGKHVYGSDLHVTLIRELEGSFRDCIKTDYVIKPVDNFDSIDLTKYIGKQIIATRRNGNRTTGVVANGAEIEVGSREIRFAGLSFDRYGNHWGSGRQCGLDIMSVEEIEQPEWITDIDLTQWIGKTVDVKLRNGTIVDAVTVSPHAGKTLYQVKVEHLSYTRWGKYWHDRLDGQDIVAIRINI